jgi:hypothetical protein
MKLERYNDEYPISITPVTMISQKNGTSLKKWPISIALFIQLLNKNSLK